jgi:hypothetical protein
MTKRINKAVHVLGNGLNRVISRALLAVALYSVRTAVLFMDEQAAKIVLESGWGKQVEEDYSI